jgi:hypothetical protein
MVSKISGEGSKSPDEDEGRVMSLSLSIERPVACSRERIVPQSPLSGLQITQPSAQECEPVHIG